MEQTRDDNLTPETGTPAEVPAAGEAAGIPEEGDPAKEQTESKPSETGPSEAGSGEKTDDTSEDKSEKEHVDAFEDESEEGLDDDFEDEPDEDLDDMFEDESEEDYDDAFEDESEEDLDDEYDDESEEGGMGLNLFTLFVLLIAVLFTVGYYTCTVRHVRVTGNSLYTSKEIAEMVISDDTQLRHNTIFLTLLYMTPKAPKIPFEESVKVIPESYDSIRIEVKDMEIAGFIPYAGKNLYFSAEGEVLENSPLLVKNATFVTGLSVTGAQTGTKMTADNEVGLDMILETLQILRKYDMHADCVVLTKSGSIVMYLDHVKILLGKSGFELKISKISQILPYLEDRSGTIDLTNYKSPDQNIILK